MKYFWHMSDIYVIKRKQIVKTKHIAVITS